MNKKYLKLLLIAGYVLLSTFIWWYCVGKSLIGTDDANIYMVYMRNFADGHGFVYNIGSERVEGFTSLLWALIGSLFYKISSRPEICLLAFNFIIITYALWKLVCFTDDYFKDQRLITPYTFLLLGLLEVIPGYFDWTILSLMETGFWSVLLILMGLDIFKWETDENSRKNSGSFIVLMVLLVVTRPESYLWGMVFIFIRMTQLYRVSGGQIAATIKGILPLAFAFIGTIVLLTIWRLNYFGYALPNTYYAKVSANFVQNFKDGFRYDAFYFIWYNMLMIVMLILATIISLQMLRKKMEYSWIFLYAFFFVLVTIAIPLYSGGDHFKNGRFFQPTMPLLWFCFLICIAPFKPDERKINPYYVISAFMVFLTFSPLNSLYKIVHDANSPILSEFSVAEKGRNISLKMNTFFKEQGKLPSQGVIDAGGRALAYNGYTNDLMGLNNTAMAHADKVKDIKANKSHASFNKQVFYDQKPDLFWIKGNFIPVGSLDTNDQMVPDDFGTIAYKKIHLDDKFRELYCKAVIFKKGEPECLAIYANREFLKLLKPEIYSYRILP